MNIKDLSPSDYKVVSSPTNLSQLPQGSFKTVSPHTDPYAFVTQQNQQQQNSGSKIGGFLKNVGNALTSSEQTFGKGLATSTRVASGATNQTGNEAGQALQDTTKLTQELHQMVLDHVPANDPKRVQLVNFLRQTQGQAPVTQAEIDPGTTLTNKQVAGAALGTALDVATVGSFGEAAKGAETGKLLTSSEKVANAAGKVGIESTIKTAPTIEELAAKSVAQKTTSIGTKAANIAKESAKGAALGYGYDVAGNAQANKDNVFKPGLGTIVGGSIPLAAEAAKGLGFIAKQVAKYTASGLSGTPVAAIEEAFKNPEAVQKAIRTAAQDPESSAQKILGNAQDAMANLKKARAGAYQEGLAQLEKDSMYTKNGQLYINRELTPAEAAKTKGYVPGTKIGVPTNLTTSGVKNVFTTTLKDFGATGGGKGLDFTNVALDDSHLAKLDKLQQRIYDWTDTTPQGLNRLRQVIDSYKVGGINLGSSESKFNKIIGDLRTNLSSYVGERVPQIQEMNNKYTAESKVIDNINNQLKLNSKDPNTALRKLLNVFNPKSVVYKPIVEQLGQKGARNLMSDIAGLTMSKWTPEGLAKYFDLSGATAAAVLHPGALVAAPLASPRVVGEVTTGLGKVAQNQKAQQAIKVAGQVGKKLITRQAGLTK